MLVTGASVSFTTFYFSNCGRIPNELNRSPCKHHSQTKLRELQLHTHIYIYHFTSNFSALFLIVLRVSSRNAICIQDQHKIIYQTSVPGKTSAHLKLEPPVIFQVNGSLSDGASACFSNFIVDYVTNQVLVWPIFVPSHDLCRTKHVCSQRPNW